MAIALSCSCGRSFRIKHELAGSKVKCPDCGSILTVPRPQPAKDPEEDAYAVLSEEVPLGQQEERRRAWEAPAAPPEPPSTRQPPKLPPAPPPMQSRPKDDSPRERGPRIAFEPGWFGSVNSGVIGGILMMAIAAVWFFLGLAADRIFIYLPILFCIGFVSMVKGFTGGGD